MIRTLALTLILVGCAQLSSKEASVSCQALDTLTTIAAVEAGARELNPIVAALIGSTGYLGFIAAKMLLAWLLVQYEGQDEVATVNIITCSAGVLNLRAF